MSGAVRQFEGWSSGWGRRGSSGGGRRCRTNTTSSSSRFRACAVMPAHSRAIPCCPTIWSRIAWSAHGAGSTCGGAAATCGPGCSRFFTTSTPTLVRQQKRCPTLVPLNPDETERAVEPAQEYAVEISQLAVALDQLPDEQRAVLLLVGLEEMTYAEAAKILGIPISTVMSRLSRGRERLRLLVANPKAGTQQTKS